MPVTDPRLRARLAEILDAQPRRRRARVGARRRRHLGTRFRPSTGDLHTTARSASSPSPRARDVLRRSDRRSASSSSRPDRRSSFPTSPTRPTACDVDEPETIRLVRRLLRHRRPAPRARRREPPLPQRRGLDGEAPGRARRRPRARSSMHVDGEPGEPPEEALDLVPRSARAAHRWCRSRGSTRCATASVVRDGDGDAGRRGRRRRGLRASTGRASRLGSASSRSSSPKAPTARSSSTLAKRLQRRRRRPARPRPEDRPRHRTARARRPRPRAARATLDLASTPLEVLHAAVATSVGHGRRPTIPACGSATTPKPCTRPGSRPAACAPTSARSARCVDRDWSESLRDELQVARRRCSARCATPTCCSSGSRRASTTLPHADADGARRAARHAREPSATGTRTTLLAALRSDRYVALLDRLVDAHASHPRVGRSCRRRRDRARASWFAEPWKQLRDAVDALDDDPPDEALHEVRIRAKRARYAAEAVAPAVGTAAKRFAKRGRRACRSARRAPGLGGRRAMVARAAGDRGRRPDAVRRRRARGPRAGCGRASRGPVSRGCGDTLAASAFATGCEPRPGDPEEVQAAGRHRVPARGQG